MDIFDTGDPATVIAPGEKPDSGTVIEIFPLNPNIFQEHAFVTKILATMVLGFVIYLIYNIGKTFMKVNLSDLSTTKFLEFIDKKNILSVIIGLMIATNARDFIKSITDNFIMALLQPILPFIQIDYVVHIGPFKFKFGKLISDMIMFLINIYIIYVMVSAFTSDLVFQGSIAL